MFLQFLLLLLALPFCTPAETITPTQPLRDGDVLVSKGARFALGFFSPSNSSHRYVGLWYYSISTTVVWVLNRDDPINDTSGVLSINTRGNLVLYRRDSLIWSTNVSVSSVNNTIAQLLDTGNLVLIQNDGKRVVWQGFDYPTDTMLPYMKLGLDRRTGLNRFLTSWKSQGDPGTGEYSHKMGVSGSPQMFFRKGFQPLWRTDPWNGLGWASVPEVDSGSIFNTTFLNNTDEVSVVYNVMQPSVLSRLTADSDGFLQFYTAQKSDSKWVAFWFAPAERCDTYGRCGPNGNCNLITADFFECTCLAGFEPKSARDWSLADGSQGCVRIHGSSVCRSGEGFIKMAHMKVPDTSAARVDTSLSLEECREECLNNCNCSAYTRASVSGSGCLSWYGDLMDTRVLSVGGQDLFLRVDAITLAQNKRKKNIFHKKWLMVILTVGLALVTVLMVSLSWLAMKKRKGKGRQHKLLFNLNLSDTWLAHYSKAKQGNESRTPSKLQLFDLSTIVAATNNLSFTNKLGRGGFGSVYKGQLSNGQEIAVKRLSNDSGQGVEEFKNEVTLTAELQHRNLVKLLGCCIEEEEKVLIYEYMPNKSLDSFIFDETKRSMLTWEKCFEIIIGIARGILYLHQDSRLRIIHRDLKASNVLLDVDMIPKISDFGMARLFGGNQIEGSTNRVVGTYGYMSPEYAMEGLFSIKSDVYSFRVLLLEIITGRRNTTYYCGSPSFNLVGYVWSLWTESKALDIVDLSLEKSNHTNEVLRCIHIGLLCVQEFAIDRPTMLTIISMLGNNSTLPPPNQPAFVVKPCHNDANSSSVEASINELTITMDAR
ncbi:G-type lectin S-receptor-like serine/threonine-protein kinase At1g11410 [Vitis vinifera]|nr:G-type lectin S-receptor-like serine/threonine-protein kinase At1g11410 [Vitis vinifera]|eukprot:XP_002270258.2 PREDICTED: G-type lectin S-receptor-like serine/threonine-protein kinase At1g11410 [Vitis vinifera]